VKPEVLAQFQKDRGLELLSSAEVEKEFIYQNTYQLNLSLYSALGEKRAFVLSHGRNMMILKIVGYAEQVAQYYKLENFDAHLWIAHQRYQPKGAYGIQEEPTPLSVSMRLLCTMGTSPTITLSPNT
jgi:hypothetical protein